MPAHAAACIKPALAFSAVCLDSARLTLACHDCNMRHVSPWHGGSCDQNAATFRASHQALPSSPLFLSVRAASAAALLCPLGFTSLCSCSDDEIKTELNARGYGAVLDMDEDLALDMLFSQLIEQLIQEEKMVTLRPGPHHACLMPEQSASRQHHSRMRMGLLPTSLLQALS